MIGIGGLHIIIQVNLDFFAKVSEKSMYSENFSYYESQLLENYRLTF